MAVRGALQWSEWTSCSWSAGGSGQVRQRPGNNNHKPICWPETALPQGPRHTALRMELIAPTRVTYSAQAWVRRASDTRPHAPILCLFLLLCWNNVHAARFLLWRLYTQGWTRKGTSSTMVTYVPEVDFYQMPKYQCFNFALDLDIQT